MSGRALVRIAIVLAIAVIAWGALALMREPVSDKTASLALPNVDTARVDTIALVKAGDTTVLTRGAGAHAGWLADGYRADSGAVAALLGGLADTARRTELVSEGKAMHGQLGVTADSGTLVRVVGGGRVLLDVVTGKRASDGAGVYLRLAHADPVYVLRGSLAEGLDRSGGWRDTRIASVVPDSVGQIEVRRAQAYAVERGPNGWRLATGSAVDTAAVSGLLGQYRALSASGFAPGAASVGGKAEGAGKGKAAAIHVALLDRRGKALFGMTMDSSASGVTARADTGGVVFRLNTWQVAELAPPEKAVAAKKGKQ